MRKKEEQESLLYAEQTLENGTVKITTTEGDLYVTDQGVELGRLSGDDLSQKEVRALMKDEIENTVVKIKDVLDNADNTALHKLHISSVKDSTFQGGI